VISPYLAYTRLIALQLGACLWLACSAAKPVVARTTHEGTATAHFYAQPAVPTAPEHQQALTNEAEQALTVLQAWGTKSLSTWGEEHGVFWLSNESDQALHCGVASKAPGAIPQYAPLVDAKPGGATSVSLVASPETPLVKCDLPWDQAAKIVGMDREDFSRAFPDALPRSGEEKSVTFVLAPGCKIAIEINHRLFL
jgi:hypothetical protein